jgi:hypothetical protein
MTTGRIRQKEELQNANCKLQTEKWKNEEKKTQSLNSISTQALSCPQIRHNLVILQFAFCILHHVILRLPQL